MTSGRCGHLMYSAQAENTPASISQNTGFSDCVQREVQPVADARADLVQRLVVLRAVEDGLAEAAAEQQRHEVIAPMSTDGIASAMSGPVTTHGLSFGGPPWWPWP